MNLLWKEIVFFHGGAFDVKLYRKNIVVFDTVHKSLSYMVVAV